MTAAMIGAAASAQETYDNAQLANKDLNGTARYVGMGGAMEALGADISTIGTNPQASVCSGEAWPTLRSGLFHNPMRSRLTT